LEGCSGGLTGKKLGKLGHKVDTRFRSSAWGMERGGARTGRGDDGGAGGGVAGSGEAGEGGEGVPPHVAAVVVQLREHLRQRCSQGRAPLRVGCL